MEDRFVEGMMRTILLLREDRWYCTLLRDMLLRFVVVEGIQVVLLTGTVDPLD